jgi:alanine racemase
MVFPAETLFFALEGSRKDGHSYIRHAYDLGCRTFVVNQKELLGDFPNCTFFVHDDVINALQTITKKHREQFSLPIIALTGSNGKTWVKEWLYAVCQDHYHVVRSPGSYNSHIGVPLSLWNIQEHHDLGIIEAGISKVGEMRLQANLIQPDIGIFTWIGDAHKEGFLSKQQKIDEKLDLFEGVSTILFCADQLEVASSIRKRFPDKDLISWSRHGVGDLNCSEVTEDHNGSEIKFHYLGFEDTYRILFSDEISIQNSLHCLLAAKFLGIPMESVQKKMMQLQPMHMRMEIVKALNNCTLINDAYSLDINSLELALQKMDVIDAQKKKTIIISDLMAHDHATYVKIAAIIDTFSPFRIFAIGHKIGMIKDLVSSKTQVHSFPNTTALLENINRTSFADEIILLKGARKFQFERIAQYLTEKNHTVSLHIDFNAMLHNLQYFSRNIRPGVGVIAVIKASAYGSGSLEIARFLEFFKLDYLAVALIDEGVDLRRGGIHMPILVLNPDSSDLDDLFDFHLEPEVYSFRILNQIIQKAQQRNMRIKVHLKINTGMNRLGFDPEDVDELSNQLNLIEKYIEVGSVFSHLSSSDDPGADEFTSSQVEVFERTYASISGALKMKPPRHLLNSSGILRFSDYEYEMVRLGIGLYGVGMGSYNQHLKPVHSLKARIVQIRNIDKGATVGYSRAFIAPQKMRIATFNLGYADGLPRHIGNGKYLFTLHGEKAPIIGNVCMDMVMCDISHIPEAMEGDDAWVFDAQFSCENLSDAAGTIPYEVLSRISPRVKRVFHYT